MKDDEPKKKQSEQDVSDGKLSSFQQDEEDVDFEILDALEQIEQAGKGSEEIKPFTPEVILDFILFQILPRCKQGCRQSRHGYG